MIDLDPQNYRIVYLVRHGQYHKTPETLTPAGREQIERTGKFLRTLGIDQLFSSTKPRAVESASLIGKILRHKAAPKSFFCEAALPGSTAFLAEMEKKGISKQKLAEKKIRADRAFDYLFKPPRKGQKSVAVVAHGNVIRYWVCRAMGIDTRKWLHMDVKNASITTLRVSDIGEITLLGFSEASHLPRRLHTYL